MENFHRYVEDNREAFVAELKRFCRQPCISAQRIGVKESARMVKGMLERLGATVRLLELEGAPPAIFGEVGDGRRSLLIYDHYDVQPPEPLELWEHKPFSADVVGDVIYARGASDDKGNLMARLLAIEAYQKLMGKLPIKIKFFFEGEEEVGSPHLEAYVEKLKESLKADGCLWEGSQKDPSGRQTIYLGVKGICYVELRCRAAKSDLHSMFATIVPNPAWRLVHALSTLKDTNDNITVDGYMEHVAPPDHEEVEALKNIPFHEDALLEQFGIKEFIGGLRGIELLKKHLFTPTCTICGLQSGYTGEGSKTVLPNQAMAKVDFRLVPKLTPELAIRLLRNHLDRRGFTDIDIIQHGAEHPSRSDMNAPLVKTVVRATEKVYGEPPIIYPKIAGTGPMYILCEGLGMPAVAAGVGHTGSNIHAPNENIHITDFILGIKFIGELINGLGAGD